MRRIVVFVAMLVMSIAVAPRLIASASVCGSGPWTVSSPDGTLSVVVEMKEPGESGSQQSGLSYRVRSGNCEVLPSAPLGKPAQGVDASQRRVRR